MKGVIFNVVEEVVTDVYGGDTWDDLLDAAASDGAAKRSPGYPAIAATTPAYLGSQRD